jgi:hypothetical protein
MAYEHVSDISPGDDLLDQEARAAEVARILRKIAYALEQGGADDGGCTDTNGNSVGTYGFRTVARPGAGNREETA